MSSRPRFALAALVIAGLLLQLATLTGYPPPHCDETYYADTANTLLTQGSFGTPVHGPVYDLDKNHTVIGRLYALGLAGVLAVLGISLTAARVYSLLGWLTACAGTYWLGLRLFGRRTALWGALLFAVSFKTFFAARITRPEIWLTAAIVWVFAALAGPKPDSAGGGASHPRALALGLAAALLADIHFNGAFFLAGLSLVALYEWFFLPGSLSHARRQPAGTSYQSHVTDYQRPRRLDLLALFFLGAALGLGLWAALHFLPDPASAWYQWRVGYTRLGMGAGSRPPLAALLDLLPWIREGFWSGNRGLNALEGLLFAAGIGFALYRRSGADVRVLLVLAGSLLTFGVLFAQKLSSYRVLWTPLLWLLAVEAVLAGWDRVAARAAPRAGPALVFVPLIALYLAGAGWLVWQFRGGRMAETTAALRAMIPPGKTVLGDPIWWFGFQADHRYYGDLYLTYYASEVSSPPGAVPVEQRLTERQVADALQRIGAQYVILDARLHCLQDEAYQPFYAYRDYVTSRCARVGEVTGGWYGQAWAVTYPLGEKSQVYQCG